MFIRAWGEGLQTLMSDFSCPLPAAGSDAHGLVASGGHGADRWKMKEWGLLCSFGEVGTHAGVTLLHADCFGVSTVL